MPNNQFNYEYVLQLALSSSASPNPRILDYGSGQGILIALGLKRNIDIYGTDVPGVEASDRVRIIAGEHIPFDDNSFDVVVSNQVFEHIQHPKPALAEIHRVLKPNGVFIALFPDETAWFEGHVGLYFVHWLMPYPKLLHAYLILCHKLGFGYFRDKKTAAEWARWVPLLMQTEVFYHSKNDVRTWWTKTFGEQPESLARDWMLSRIASNTRLRRFLKIAEQPWMASPLSFICRIRAGLIMRIHKRKL